MMEQGLLYFAKGEEFLAEAERSARQAEAVMPEYPIAIVADREPSAGCFDTVIIDDSPFDKRDKPRALQRTPYDQTIYLDTDTYLHDRIDELFEILNPFQLGLRRAREQAHVPADSPLPDAFPEFNSGVIAYRSDACVMDMLEDWERRCRASDEFDQRSLRPALYHSDIRFAPLPNRYNCQYHWDNIVEGPVKVFHGPLVDREARKVHVQDAISKLNSTHGVRLHYTWTEHDGRGKTEEMFVDPRPSLSERGRLIFQEHGLKGLLLVAARKLKRRLPML
jgi:hypothetical protein